jgi:hypothetical protein
VPLAGKVTLNADVAAVTLGAQQPQAMRPLRHSFGAEPLYGRCEALSSADFDRWTPRSSCGAPALRGTFDGRMPRSSCSELLQRVSCSAPRASCGVPALLPAAVRAPLARAAGAALSTAAVGVAVAYRAGGDAVLPRSSDSVLTQVLQRASCGAPRASCGVPAQVAAAVRSMPLLPRAAAVAALATAAMYALLPRASDSELVVRPSAKVALEVDNLYGTSA